MTALTYLYIPSQPMTPFLCSAHLTAEHRLNFRRDAFTALEAAIAAGEDAVVLDLSRVESIDASGLGVLILLQKRARERGLSVRLVALPEVVETLFEETEMGPLFDIVR